MNTFETELHTHTHKICLKKSEREALRERIFSYMEYHPLNVPTELPISTAFVIPAAPFITFRFKSYQLKVAGLVFVCALIATPFVAERSVPGDVLYLVKTGVNESVQGTFVSTPYEKIEFETKLMERRIGEARVLANEGKLTEEVEQQITETVKEHTEAVKQSLVELREQDSDKAAIAEIAFTSSLEVQSAVLGAGDTEEKATQVDSILTVVNDVKNEIASEPEHAPASYDGLLAQVEQETTRAYELLATIEAEATAEEIGDIHRRLDDINRLTEEAKRDHDAHPEFAQEHLVNTLGFAQKLIAFMSDINIRETVALSDLVPVVLSDVERVAILHEQVNTMNTLKTHITEKLTADTVEDGLRDKAAETLTGTEQALLEVAVALDTSDTERAEGIIAEALPPLQDLSVLVDQAVPDEATPSTTPEMEVASTSPTTTPDSETQPEVMETEQSSGTDPEAVE